MLNPINTTEAPASTTRHATLVALLVAGAFFMENLDGTVIATALPQMAVSFGANPVDLNMGITAYLLTLAVFIPVSGWIADRLGARTIFAFAIALFTFSSILCGISNGLFEFTAARILQGIGGAMMVPVGRLVVLRVTEKKDLIRSIAYITWPGLAAPVIGPPTGGFITTYLSWRWIFFLNVPLGIVGIVLAMLWIKNQREGTGSFDWFGFAMAGSACISFMYSLELFGRQDVRWRAASIFLSYGLLAGYIAVRHMLRARHPLIDLKCLKAQTFAIVIFGGSLFRIAISSTPFLLPLMFQLAFGLNAFQSGLLILAMFAGNLLMKSVTTPVLRRFGFRNSLIVNGMITAVLIFSFSFVSPDTPRMLMVPLLFAHGLSRSMQFTSINTIAFVDIPKSVLSSASSFYAVAQQLSMGMGAAVGAMALRIAASVHGTPSSMPATSDFHVAFALISLIALLGVADSLTLEKSAGAEVSGHKMVAR
jgi:EmrB/QacA subfamily drug resistance transporter